MRRWTYTLTILMLFCLSACSGIEELLADFESTDSQQGTTTVGDVERGREIFRNGVGDAQRCANCHRVTTRGFAVDAAPNLEGIAEVAGERIEGMSAEDYLIDSIINPLNLVVDVFRTPMPEDYAELLTEQEIADVVAYMMQLTPPE